MTSQGTHVICGSLWLEVDQSLPRHLVEPVGAGAMHVAGRFHRALIWHPAHSSPSHVTTTRTSPRTRQCKNQCSYNASVRPRTKDCEAFNQGKCDRHRTHTNQQHICAFCLVVVKWAFPHLEEECNRKKGRHAKKD